MVRDLHAIGGGHCSCLSGGVLALERGWLHRGVFPRHGGLLPPNVGVVMSSGEGRGEVYLVHGICDSGLAYGDEGVRVFPTFLMDMGCVAITASGSSG